MHCRSQQIPFRWSRDEWYRPCVLIDVPNLVLIQWSPLYDNFKRVNMVFNRQFFDFTASLEIASTGVCRRWPTTWKRLIIKTSQQIYSKSHSLILKIDDNRNFKFPRFNKHSTGLTVTCACGNLKIDMIITLPHHFRMRLEATSNYA
jgi:hypothetical protein